MLSGGIWTGNVAESANDTTSIVDMPGRGPVQRCVHKQIASMWKEDYDTGLNQNFSRYG